MSLTQSTTIMWNFVVEGVPLKISSPAIPVLQVGSPFSLQLSASGGTGKYIWAVDDKNADGTPSVLPVGLALDQNGMISGTPTEASPVDAQGNYIAQNVTIRVKDSAL